MTPSKTVKSIISTFDTDAFAVREFANRGFVVALNVGWAGPRYWHSEFPNDWSEYYQSKNLFIMDPVYFWAVRNTGAKRWSEIEFPDLTGVLKSAAKHDLKYGVIVSTQRGKMRSFLTAARNDREFSETEVRIMSKTMDHWATEAAGSAAKLSDGEIDVLQLLREGSVQSEIAHHLGIAESTVKKRCSTAMKKLGASNRTHAVSIAVDQGLLT